jgi:hypothetical protein
VAYVGEVFAEDASVKNARSYTFSLAAEADIITEATNVAISNDAKN